MCCIAYRFLTLILLSRYTAGCISDNIEYFQKLNNDKNIIFFNSQVHYFVPLTYNDFAVGVQWFSGVDWLDWFTHVERIYLVGFCLLTLTKGMYT